MAELSFGLTPYRYGANNPVLFRDPDGLFEFNSYQAYVDYAKANDLTVMDRSSIGTQGHWLASDRRTDSNVWHDANVFNLVTGQYNQYTTITQRTAFYEWMAGVFEAQGHEVQWVGAAYAVASLMMRMDNEYVGAMVDGFNDDIVGFANAGNKMIFDDVFDRLRSLFILGEEKRPLTGNIAKEWDIETLRREQFDIVDDLYQKLSKNNPAAVKILEVLSHTTPVPIIDTGMKDLTFKGDLLNPQDRFDHGMTNMVEYYKILRGRRNPKMRDAAFQRYKR